MPAQHIQTTMFHAIMRPKQPVPSMVTADQSMPSAVEALASTVSTSAVSASTRACSETLPEMVFFSKLTVQLMSTWCTRTDSELDEDDGSLILGRARLWALGVQMLCLCAEIARSLQQRSLRRREDTFQCMQL